MWKVKHYSNCVSTLIYFISNKKVCEIPIEGTDDVYRGYVMDLPIEIKVTEIGINIPWVLIDCDLDVLKLKCLKTKSSLFHIKLK